MLPHPGAEALLACGWRCPPSLCLLVQELIKLTIRNLINCMCGMARDTKIEASPLVRHLICVKIVGPLRVAKARIGHGGLAGCLVLKTLVGQY